MGKRLPIRRDHGASCPKTEFSDHEMATVKASAWSHTFETRAVTPIRVLGGSRHLGFVLPHGSRDQRHMRAIVPVSARLIDSLLHC